MLYLVSVISESGMVESHLFRNLVDANAKFDQWMRLVGGNLVEWKESGENDITSYLYLPQNAHLEGTLRVASEKGSTRKGICKVYLYRIAVK